MRALQLSEQVRRTIMSKKETKVDSNSLRFKTGSDLLDLVVGGGIGMGFPAGKIVNIVGDKSTGKTFIACELIAASKYALGERLKWRYDDCESGFTFDTKSMYGFEIMPEDTEKRQTSSTVQDLYGNVRGFLESLKKDEVGIYVVDSLDGLTSTEQDERADKRFRQFQRGEEFKEKSYQMEKAKYLSQEFFPQLAGLIEDKKALLVIISQVRDNVEAFSFEKYVRAGGKAMDFYCHTVLWLASIAKIKRLDRSIGTVNKARTTKSKTPRPYRECLFSLIFDYGLDNTGSNIDFLYDLRGDSGALLDKSKSIVWNGVEQSKATLQEFLEANKAWEDCRAAYKESTGKGEVPKKSFMLEWIQNNKGLCQLYEDHFGASMTRDELIEFVESKGLQEELTQKVVEKWEAIEDQIKSNRAPKYRN